HRRERRAGHRRGAACWSGCGLGHRRPGRIQGPRARARVRARGEERFMKELPPLFAEPARDPPDARGRFGNYGGRFVPETLIPALDELAEAWTAARADSAYRDELAQLLVTYAGRPTPLFR